MRCYQCYLTWFLQTIRFDGRRTYRNPQDANLAWLPNEIVSHVDSSLFLESHRQSQIHLQRNLQYSHYKEIRS